MSRSLYKPIISQELRLVNLNKKEQAFYRGDDLRGRKVYRFATKESSTVIVPEFRKFRILIYTGRRFARFLITRKKFGHRLGEFRRTKLTGARIHRGNKSSRKRQKQLARLRMEAQKRKNRKKKTVRQKRKEAEKKRSKERARQPKK